MSERMTPEALTDALIKEGVLASDAPPPAAEPDDRPWFIGALQGMAGWLAGVAALVVIFELIEPRKTFDFAVLGAILLAIAFGLYRTHRSSAFLHQLALAASIAGQLSATAAFVIGAGSSIAVPTACVALLQCLLVFVMPNALARSLAAFFACVAWALAVRFMWWGEEEVWDGGVRYTVALLPALIGWAVIWIPAAALSLAAIKSEAQWMARPAARIVRPALSGLLLALTIGTFSSEPVSTFVWEEPGVKRESWLVLWPLLNAATAMLAGFGAFRLRNKALLGIAIAAALLHVGQFYFLLGTTLIVKSIIMVVLGAVLLGLGMTLARRTASASEGAP